MGKCMLQQVKGDLSCKISFIFLVVFFSGLGMPSEAPGQQKIDLYVLDASNGFPQAFIKITNVSDSSESLSGVNGLYQAHPGDQLIFEHPLYQSRAYMLNYTDTVQFVYLDPLDIRNFDDQSESEGRKIFRQFQDTMALKSYKLLPYLKYELANELIFYSREKTSDRRIDSIKLNEWEKYLRLTTLEENISQGPKKNRMRVIYAKAETSDSTIITATSNTLMPLNLQNIPPLQEYISIYEAEFYNPLYPKAGSRYRFHYIGNIELNQQILDVVLCLPAQRKKYASIDAVLYFENETKHLKGSSYRPAKALAFWQLSSDYINLPEMTGMQHNVSFEIFVKKLPKNDTETLVMYFSTKDKLQLDQDSAVIRKNDFRIFQSGPDAEHRGQDEYFNLEPLQESEKLEYLERDTGKGKFINRKWYDLMVNLALQNIGVKVGSGYFNNIFRINAYEWLRVGVGYQSMNLISERLKFGGYLGYAINPEGVKDQGWRLGFNSGVYLGKGKRQYLEYSYRNDVLEPGRTFYLYEQKDLVRNFFTSRMGLTVSNELTYTSTINNNFIFRINFNRFSFDPQFYYWYKSSPEDSTNFFRFSEMGFKLRIGKYSTMNPALSRLLLLKRGFVPTFYINYVEGFDNAFEGEYSYRKVNMKIKTYFYFNEKYHLDFTTEAGLSTKEIPYPVAYAGAGNITELASIIVLDAFQTMDLYAYLSDRYLNTFTTFYVNFKSAKKNRMRPQVGFAWNMGWGKFNGNIDIHSFEEGEGVSDYRNGFYETGILFTNFLQVRLLGLLRGQFGMGAFVNVGPTDQSRLAFRATYKITTF